MNEKKSCAISRRSFLKGAGAVGAASVLAACGGNSTAASGSGAEAAAEGKVINIYSWNDEFRTRLEAVYSEVASTSSDGTVTTLKDGTEIHWIINPNQDGVYQQKLDEALLNQASGSTDDKVDIFLSETDYVYKYTDAEADVAMPLTDLGIDPTPTWPTSTPSPRPPLRTRTGSSAAPPGSAARAFWSTGGILRRTSLVPMIRPRWAKKSKTGTPSKPPRKS